MWYSLLHAVISRVPAWLAVQWRIEPLRHDAEFWAVLLRLSSQNVPHRNPLPWGLLLAAGSFAHKSLKVHGLRPMRGGFRELADSGFFGCWG